METEVRGDGGGRFRALVRAAGLLALIAAATGSMLVNGASAATITTTGPLTSIGVSEDLNCSVRHLGDEVGERRGGRARRRRRRR